VARVRDAAATLGYVPNPQAKALSTGTRDAIGLVVPDIGNPFFPPLIRAADLRATASEVAVLIADSEEDATREASALGRLATRTDGIILVSSRQSKTAISAFARQVPLVIVNRDVPGIPQILIATDVGLGHAVEHLAQLGHRHIAYLTGPKHSWSNQERLKAVSTAVERLGIRLTTIKGYMPSYEDGARCVKELLGCGATGVIAFDDIMAQGVMGGLAAIGVSVPSEMSVIGCDDLLAARTYPPLTSVQSRSAEGGEVAVDLLLSNASRNTKIILRGDLIVRSTTAPPKNP